MSQIYFVERNGKRYAYRSTSKYEPGKRYPVTVNEYLGRVDETTGEVIPKKNRPSAANSIDPVDLKTKRFGGSYVLLDLATSMGLRDDLFESFGMDGDRLLASAVAQVLSGGPLSSVEDTMDGCMVGELIGIAERFDSPRMSEFTRRMGDSFDSMETLFEKRVSRAKEMLSYDITSVSTYSRMRGWGEWGHNRDGESLKQANIGLVTDKKGVPAMFELYPGSISDVATLQRTAERLKQMDADCTIVMDRGFGSVANLAFLIENGTSFVIPGKRGTKCVKALMSELAKRKGEVSMERIHEGVSYFVLEREVSIVPKKEKAEEDDDSNDTYELEMVTSDDIRFEDGKRMKAFVCYDEKKSAEDNIKLRLTLSDIESRLKSMNPFAAVRDIKRIAGPYAKYFDCLVDENGSLHIDRKQNAYTFSANRAGMFVMFSHGVDEWQDMMSCYDCRSYVEQAFDVLKNELDGNRWRTPDPVSAKGRLLIKFIALILWCELSALLRDDRKRTPVTSVLQSLDNITASRINGIWYVSEVSRKNRDWMQRFGTPLPAKHYELVEHDFVPRTYLH